MKGLRLHSWRGELVAEELREPVAADGAVLIEVEACGVGLTVLNCIARHLGRDPEDMPRVPGHELVARVIATGPGIDPARTGERVMAYFYLFCGTCASCLAGQEDLCEDLTGLVGVDRDRGYAERAALPARNAITPVHVAGRASIRLDHRFKACVAWGAIWDYHAIWKRRVEANFAGSQSVPGHHMSWVLGVDTLEQALAKLEDFGLDRVVQQMRCPFLVLHGEHDEQVPLEVAERLVAASGSADKTLRVFAAQEGGDQHCQSDQLTSAVAKFSGWLAEKL